MVPLYATLRMQSLNPVRTDAIGPEFARTCMGLHEPARICTKLHGPARTCTDLRYGTRSRRLRDDLHLTSAGAVVFLKSCLISRCSCRWPTSKSRCAYGFGLLMKSAVIVGRKFDRPRRYAFISKSTKGTITMLSQSNGFTSKSFAFREKDSTGIAKILAEPTVLSCHLHLLQNRFRPTAIRAFRATLKPRFVSRIQY